MATTHTHRRGFLGALFAAPVVAAAPAMAIQAPASVVEAPELLAIGARLPDITARIQMARDRLDEALATYERLRPAVPTEIIAPVNERGDLTEVERGLDNEPIVYEEAEQRLRYFYAWRRVKAHIIVRDISGRTSEGKRLRRIARLAEKFERDNNAALVASGYVEADLALIYLRMELQDDFAHAALGTPPRTMAGIGICAAIVALGSGKAHRDGKPVGYCEALAVAMAASLVALNVGGGQ